jgi:hypothetical protein
LLPKDTSPCEDCGLRKDKGIAARGLCQTCYMRRRRAGTIDEARSLRFKRFPVGSRRVDHVGYVYVKMPDGTRKHEHRLVMEQMLGRPLITDETVHHKNGDRADNRAENLEIWFKGQPAGQKVEDLINYVVRHHLNDLLAAIDREIAVYP